jgi:molecular chaperone GrpE (heat shock protein)
MGTSWWGSKEKSGIGPDPTYKVLQADLIKGSEKERAAAIASFVMSDQDAHKLAGHEGFSYKGLDMRGRCGVILYKGMEVALLFKREVCQITPGPADPVPERALKEPTDAWIQINLLNTDESDRQKGVGEKLRQAMAQVDRLRSLWKAEEADKLMLENKLIKLEGSGVKLSQALEENLLLKANVKGTEAEIESLKKEVRQGKDLLVATKKNMVEEIFPIFNTIWLAGVHRVGDTLYGILKKQMMDALSKIGVSLIEPEVGGLFDPTFHHAVHSHELEEGDRKIGCVTQVHRVGWRLGSMVMAPADVGVGVEKRSTNENVTVAQEQQGRV